MARERLGEPLAKPGRFITRTSTKLGDSPLAPIFVFLSLLASFCSWTPSPTGRISPRRGHLLTRSAEVLFVSGDRIRVMI
jgi:hypothetical protein